MAHDFIPLDLPAMERFDTLHAGISQALAAWPETGFPRGLCTSKRRDFAVKILARWACA